MHDLFQRRRWRYGLILSVSLSLHLTSLSTDPVRFENIASKAGIDFTLRNSATGKKHLIETMTGGVAVFDYNNDDRPDIYFVNGAQIPELKKTESAYFNRLFRNDGDGRFTDVTLQAGVQGEGYGMGLATGDYDNDGDVDLFVAGVNRNILYRNRGDGTFEDTTAGAGLQTADQKPWSVAAGWFDYDRDGSLDLFVVNYLTWSMQDDRICPNPAAPYRIYCHPRYYRGLPNALYRNNRNGTFTNVSHETGIASHVGKGMGVVFADYDDDGNLDVFVGNDTLPNFLFRNEDAGTFAQVALSAGVAVNADGRPISSMGVDFRDYDNDGREDLFVTALIQETFPLFRNLGGGAFRDVTYESKVGLATTGHTGWGNGIFDFNNDGLKDLFAATGDLDDNAEVFSTGKTKQRNVILLNRGGGRFVNFSDQAGDIASNLGQHRGAAFGDFDRDGRIDLVVTRLNERAQLFRNTTDTGNHWLGLRLAGRRSNRDGIGARVKVTSASGMIQWNRVTTAVGYGSASDRIVHFGLRKDVSARRVEIEWPSGVRQKLENVTADRYHTIMEP